MTQHELLTAWLRDAHSMEKALEDFANKAISNFSNNETKEKLEAIKLQSSAAQTELGAQLQHMNESTSDGKDFLGKAIGFLGGAGSSLYKDDAVKDMLVLHGAFHFAHASYASLAHAAEISSKTELQALCHQLAEGREAVASWALEMIPVTTEEALREAGKS